MRSNASAHGFSVAIHRSHSSFELDPGDARGHADRRVCGWAVAAFAIVELVVSRGFTRGLDDEPGNAKELGSSIIIFSVGLAIASAYAVGRSVGHFVARPLGSFSATSAYLLLFGVELSLANRLQLKRSRNDA